MFSTAAMNLYHQNVESVFVISWKEFCTDMENIEPEWSVKKIVEKRKEERNILGRTS